MKKIIGMGVFSALLAFAPSMSNASMQSAVNHGVEPLDYRKARSVWAQTKQQISCRKHDPLLSQARRSFNADDFYLESDMEVIVTYIYDGARARNVLGWYNADTPEDKRIIWRDASTGRTAPLEQGSKASLGVLPMGTHLRFFLMVDGAREGDLMIYQDAELNPGKTNQVAARLWEGQEGKPFVLGFEDRPNGGDEDFNDVIIQIELRPVEGPSLYRVNSNTGKASLVSQLSVSGAYTSVLSDPVTGELLLMNEAGGRLVQVNPFTTEISSQVATDLSGRKIERIAYSDIRESLYAYDGVTSSIVRFDFDTGVSDTIVDLDEGQVLLDFVYDEANDRILALLSGGVADTEVFAITNLDGQAILTKLTDVDIPFVGIAWDAENRLIAYDPLTGNNYILNPNTGSTELLGDSEVESDWMDLTSVGQNPDEEGAPPSQLYSSGADVVTQHDDVIAGIDGINSNRRGSGLKSVLQQEGMFGSEFEKFHELFYIPLNATELEFEMLKDYGSFKFHFGMFDYSVVDGLVPGSLEWNVTAVENSIGLFDDRITNPGAKVTLDVQELGLAGKVVCFFIVPNNTISVYLRNPWRYSPKGNGNNTKRQPLFTVSAANPGQLDQAMAFGNETNTIFSFEDLTRYNTTEPGWNSDNSFDDLTFSVTPALEAVGTPVEVFMLEPAEESVRNRQTTAEVLVDWDYVKANLDSLEAVDIETNELLHDAYVTVTYLSGNSEGDDKISFDDPHRPYESVLLFPNSGIAASFAENNDVGPSLGLGYMAAGTQLRFSWADQLKRYYTEGALNSDTAEYHIAGRIPGTDTIIVKIRKSEADEGVFEHILAVTFEAWDLQYSGDVRNVLYDGDGRVSRGTICY